jgi:hypothetical protein
MHSISWGGWMFDVSDYSQGMFSIHGGFQEGRGAGSIQGNPFYVENIKEVSRALFRSSASEIVLIFFPYGFFIRLPAPLPSRLLLAFLPCPSVLMNILKLHFYFSLFPFLVFPFPFFFFSLFFFFG